MRFKFWVTRAVVIRQGLDVGSKVEAAFWSSLVGDNPRQDDWCLPVIISVKLTEISQSERDLLAAASDSKLGEEVVVPGLGRLVADRVRPSNRLSCRRLVDVDGRL